MSVDRFDPGTARDAIRVVMWRMVAIAIVGLGLLSVLMLVTGRAGYRGHTVTAPGSAEPHRARLLHHGSSRTAAPMEL